MKLCCVFELCVFVVAGALAFEGVCNFRAIAKGNKIKIASPGAGVVVYNDKLQLGLPGDLESLPESFWNSDSRCTITVWTQFRQMAKGQSVLECAKDAFALIGKRVPAPARRDVLLLSAFDGILHGHTPEAVNISGVLSGLPRDVGLIFLRSWSTLLLQSAPASDVYAKALAAATTAYPGDEASLREAVARIAIQVESFSNPDAALKLLASAKLSDSDRLKQEILNLSISIDPNRGEKLLSESYRKKTNNSIDSKQIGAVARNGGISVDAFHRIYRKASEKERSELLAGYLGEYDNDISELVSVFDPGEIPKPKLKALSSRILLQSPWAFNEWMSRVTPQQRSDQLESVLTQDVQNLGPESAAIVLEAVDNKQCSGKNFSDLINALDGREPEKALRCIARLPAEARTQAERKEWGILAKKASLERPDDIKAFLEKAPPSAQGNVISEFAEKLNAKGYDVALQLLDGVKDPAVQAKLEASILANPNSDMPLDKLESICLERARTALNPDIYYAAANELIKETADADTGACIGQIEKFPPGPLREKLSASLAKYWSSYDPEGCSAWVAKMPPSHTRDVASAEVVAASTKDPVDALKIIAVISDPKLRIDSAKKIVSYWKKIDPSYIEALVKDSGLSPEERDALNLAPSSDDHH